MSLIANTFYIDIVWHYYDLSLEILIQDKNPLNKENTTKLTQASCPTLLRNLTTDNAKIELLVKSVNLKTLWKYYVSILSHTTGKFMSNKRYDKIFANSIYSKAEAYWELDSLRGPYKTRSRTNLIRLSDLKRFIFYLFIIRYLAINALSLYISITKFKEVWKKVELQKLFYQTPLSEK